MNDLQTDPCENLLGTNCPIVLNAPGCVPFVFNSLQETPPARRVKSIKYVYKTALASVNRRLLWITRVTIVTPILCVAVVDRLRARWVCIKPRVHILRFRQLFSEIVHTRKFILHRKQISFAIRNTSYR